MSYETETTKMVTEAHDSSCLFQATCEAYENSEAATNPEAAELTDEQALAMACMYIRECMKDCDCRTGAAGEANGWGNQPFVSYAAAHASK